MIEKTVARKSKCVRHISTSSCLNIRVYNIELSPADDPSVDTRIILYYRHCSEVAAPEMDTLLKYMATLITGPLSLLGLHGSPPCIIQRDPNLTIETIDYDPEKRKWKMTGHCSTSEDLSASKLSLSSAVDSIEISGSRKERRHPYMHGRWQSTSLEYERLAASPLQISSSFRHRKHSFMASSALLPHKSFSTYPASRSPKAVHPQGARCSPANEALDHSLQASSAGRDASYDLSAYAESTDMYMDTDEEKESCTIVELDGKVWAANGPVDVNVNITLDGQSRPVSANMTDRFAHLCIRYYERRYDDDGDRPQYIYMQEPIQFLQYLTEEIGCCDVGETDEIPEGFRIELTIQPRASEDDRLGVFVNGKEWPYRSRNVQCWHERERESMDSSYSSDSDRSTGDSIDSSRDKDVFGSHMEPDEVQAGQNESSSNDSSKTGEPSITLQPSRQVVPHPCLVNNMLTFDLVLKA